MESSELEYVGFWARVGAALIDTLLAALVLLPLLHFIYGGSERLSAEVLRDPVSYLLNGGRVFGWSDLFDLLLSAAAIVVFWIARQATPGKMLIGARIVDAATGDKPTTAQLIGRYFAYYVSIIPFGLGLLWVAFDPRKQGWHDKLAGTVVVRCKSHGRTPVQFKPQ
jgi:uncharacterized RDD family membrane protein YckC